MMAEIETSTAMFRDAQLLMHEAPTAAQEYADLVAADLTRAVAAIIRAGERLIAAKEKLPHGEFLRMFAGREGAVDRPLRISVSTAERLMAIARHPVIRDSAHGPNLPASWRTLYELTKLPEEVLLGALADGRIQPNLERRDVEALRAPASPPC